MPPATGVLRKARFPIPHRRMRNSPTSNSILGGMLSVERAIARRGEPGQQRRATGFAGAPFAGIRQCRRSKRPATVAPSWSGTSNEPAMPAPCTCTAVPRAAGARDQLRRRSSSPAGATAWHRPRSGAAASKRRRGRRTPPDPVQRIQPVHAPADDQPIGRRRVRHAAASCTRTPVCCPLLRLRSESRLPSSTATSPRSIGRFTSTVASIASDAGFLRTGSGRSIEVPTRFERNCRARRRRGLRRAVRDRHRHRPCRTPVQVGLQPAEVAGLVEQVVDPGIRLQLRLERLVRVAHVRAGAQREHARGAVVAHLQLVREETAVVVTGLPAHVVEGQLPALLAHRGAGKVDPALHASAAPSWWNGSSMWKSAVAGPATRRLSITSPCSLQRALPQHRQNAPASPAAFASTLSSARPNRGMPA